jgi:hypothetical protein
MFSERRGAVKRAVDRGSRERDRMGRGDAIAVRASRVRLLQATFGGKGQSGTRQLAVT